MRFGFAQSQLLLFEKRVVKSGGIGCAETILAGQAEQILEDVFIDNFTQTNPGGASDSTADKRADHRARKAA
jgi:hypothetical protein